LIQILTNTKAPYNVSLPTAAIGLSALSVEGLASMSRSVATLNDNRDTLIASLKKVKGVGRILGGNHANFVLAEILDADGKPSNSVALSVYKTMAETKGVVVRFRGTERGCQGCLRITVGTAEECQTAVQRIEELLA
jgi:histidinol-phosphate aminotransferase